MTVVFTTSRKGFTSLTGHSPTLSGSHVQPWPSPDHKVLKVLVVLQVDSSDHLDTHSCHFSLSLSLSLSLLNYQSINQSTKTNHWNHSERLFRPSCYILVRVPYLMTYIETKTQGRYSTQSLSVIDIYLCEYIYGAWKHGLID